jgi:hypothetical protein
MFGCYDIPFELEKEGIALSLEKEGKGLVYRSACAGARLEKILLAETGKVFINPIEPLNKPKELTSLIFSRSYGRSSLSMVIREVALFANTG